MTSNDNITDLLGNWPDPDSAAIALVTADGILALGGATDRVSRIASVSKLLVGLAALVAIEEGTITLDEPAGPRGATVRHLLSHSSGLAFDEHQQLAPAGTRRIYSNAGIEQFADHLAAAAAMEYAQYQHEAVIGPLNMTATELRGSPAHSVFSSVDDLILLAQELLRPTVIDPSTLAFAVTSQFPDLRGVLPGFGGHDPNPWGLGMELRGDKHPHWTAPGNSVSTFGHFGGSGTFVWVDPQARLACVAISGTEFGPWAIEVWPAIGQTLLDRYA